jgi:hypothetical protein
VRVLEALVQRERKRDAATRERDDEGTGRARRLRCAGCGTEIADVDAKIEISGAHRHVFCNPHGHVFEIGCFAQAPGVSAIGPASAFFSWFPGYAWRVAVCNGCRAHLGWCYGDAPDFVGLILPRLVDDE